MTAASATSTTNAPLLEVNDLVVEMKTERGRLRVVDGLDLTVSAGETVGLVGESGCGKTVTSLALMRLLPPNALLSGRIALEGIDLTLLTEREMADVRGARMAMIFQEPRRSLNPAFTVGEQIAEAVRRHRGVGRREAWSRAMELLDLVEIPESHERSQHYPHEFSGGMCQRVMLAMALACEPKLLIADEPTTALDVTVQAQVLELVYSLQQRLGLGVLLVTHDLGVVAEVCDRVAVMYAGQIVEHASVLPLFDAPAHPYTQGLLGAIPDPIRHADSLGYIDGTVPPPFALPAGCRFHPRCQHVRDVICTAEPVALRPIGSAEAGRLVRCARAEELPGRGAQP